MQLGLFGNGDGGGDGSRNDGGNAAVDFSEERHLASRLPPELLLGTSSWTFPGWQGLVYPGGTTLADLRRRGLELYCNNPLFRTVGIDSSFYRPSSEAVLGEYAGQLPPGFRCVSKVSREVTTRCDPRSLAASPHYLDARFFEREVLAPIDAAFRDHQGPLVLEFPALPHAPQSSPRDFAAALGRFFERVSREFPYAVELRDRLLLGPEYVDVLQRHGVAHVFNYWERMPELAEQQRRVDVHAAAFGVVRLLIPPGLRYADRKRKLEPFDRIVEVRARMRADTLDLVEAFSGRGAPLYVIANNKAEGSSPLTVRGLAEDWVKRQEQSEPTGECRGSHSPATAQSGAGSPPRRVASPKRS